MARKRKEKTGLLIKVDRSVRVVHVDISKDLEELYELINCTTVQMVEAPKSRFKIWLDEQGKLDGLPVNVIATALFGQAPNDYIVGDVVVLT